MENYDGECIFCKISKGEIPAERFLESENFFVVEDKNPITKGHMLIIPKKHYKTLLDIPSILGNELLSIEKETALKLIKEDRTIEGFNIIMNNFSIAGQLIHHAHVHLIPRRKNDGMRFSYKSFQG
jgi:histidine triad (HIT) family protein